MTKILDWRQSDDPRDIVHLAVQALTEGHVVALPSNHSYLLIASGLCEQAVQQLARKVDSKNSAGLALMIRSPDESLDYFPDISRAARRFAKKSWPGPIMLSIQDSHASSALRCLKPGVGEALHSDTDRIRLWQPTHDVLTCVQRLCAGPLISCRADSVHGTMAESIRDIPEEDSVLAIDDGRIESPGDPTVVEIDGNIARVVQAGMIDEQQLRELNRWTVLFVCTGNTCRSPMAQAMMQKKIADRFGKAAERGEAPVIALSAGVSAFGGDPASHGAAQAVQAYGAKLDQHCSTQLNSSLIEQADLILAMGQRHRHVIVSQWPSVASKVHLISPDGGEINDPFGGPLEVYQKCAQQLNEYTDYWIDRLDMDSLIQWST